MAPRYYVCLTLALGVGLSSLAFGQIETRSAIIRKLDCGRAVNDVAFSQDGIILAAACGRWSGWGGIRLWKTTDWTVTDLGEGEGEKYFCDRIAVSPSGGMIAGISTSGVLSLWQIATGKKVTHVRVSTDPESIQFLNEDKLVVLAGNVLYDVAVKTGTRKVIARGVQAAGVSPTRDLIAVATKSTLQLRRPPGYKIEKNLPSNFPFFARIAPDETLLVTGGGGIGGRKSVEIRSLPSGELKYDLTKFRAGVFAASISHSGKSVLLAGGSYGSGGDLSAWSLPEALQIGYRSFGKMPFESVAWAPDDSYFAAGSADGYVVLYAAADFRGPAVKDQEESICGTIVAEEGHPTLRPLTQVPTPNRRPMMWAWGLSVDGTPDWATDGTAVAVENWALSSTAGEDTAIVREAKVVSRSPESIVIGDISNPGWNRGLLIRIYGDNQFAASTNLGKCLTFGRLADVVPGVTFGSLLSKLETKAFNAMPAEPLTRGMDHFRMRFISQVNGKNSETRSDAPGSKEFDDLYATLLEMLSPVAKLAGPLEMAPIRGLAVPK